MAYKLLSNEELLDVSAGGIIDPKVNVGGNIYRICDECKKVFCAGPERSKASMRKICDECVKEQRKK